MKSMGAGGDSAKPVRSGTFGKGSKVPESGGWTPAFAQPQLVDQQQVSPKAVQRGLSGHSLKSNRPLPETPDRDRLERMGSNDTLTAPSPTNQRQHQHHPEDHHQQNPPQQQQQMYMNQEAAIQASVREDGSNQLYMNNAEARRDYLQVGESLSAHGGEAGDGEEAVVPSLPPLKPGETVLVTAIYKYVAAAADELALIEGSQILVTEVAEDGWVYGSSCLTGAVGWFHGSYVQADSESRFVVGSRDFTPEAGSRQAEKALSFSVNERLRVLAETSETWWIAQRQTAGKQVGFIPAKYVKQAPQPKPRTMRSMKAAAAGGGGSGGNGGGGGAHVPPLVAPTSPDPVPEVWLADLETAEKQYVVRANV